ncbi:MAG TPA: hypothetical protein P5077_07585, partial [bacterium]|nr:hypothetical protein [bacterium]
MTPDGGDVVDVGTDDFIFIEADEIISDADIPVGCPSLKYYANVKAAGFPFKDGNGKITFCRPGCDTPTENDPQCVKNLWTWINWKRYQEYATGVDTLRECYPWPCELPDMKARRNLHECDRNLASQEYIADMGALYDLKLYKNTVGILMTNPHASKAMTYDVTKDAYTSIAHSGHGVGFHYDRFVFYTTYEDYVNSDTGYGNTYIATAKKNGADYKYEVIYDDAEHMAQFNRPPFVGGKWVLLNVDHAGQGKIEVLYAKVDEWVWHPLKPGQVYEGNIVDNRLTFITDQRQIFVCDLDKLPFDPEKECMRVDRGGETAYQPRLNEENKNQMVYFNAVGDPNMTLVDLSGEKPVYSSLPFTISEPQSTGAYPHQFKGNLILYDEAYMPLDNSRMDY